MPSAPHLRRFGLSVGGVFLLLAAISLWRGHRIPPVVLATLGTVLVLPALVRPTLLAPVERAWMRLGGALHRINSAILLTVIYYALLTPLAVILRRFKDPMSLKLDDRPSRWVRRRPAPADPARYRQPF